MTLTLAGMPEVIDIFALAPWPLLRTALRERSAAGDASAGCLLVGHSTLVSERQWDLCSDDTLALIILEALLEAGWRHVAVFPLCTLALATGPSSFSFAIS